MSEDLKAGAVMTALEMVAGRAGMKVVDGGAWLCATEAAEEWDGLFVAVEEVEQPSYIGADEDGEPDLITPPPVEMLVLTPYGAPEKAISHIMAKLEAQASSVIEDGGLASHKGEPEWASLTYDLRAYMRRRKEAMED